MIINDNDHDKSCLIYTEICIDNLSFLIVFNESSESENFENFFFEKFEKISTMYFQCLNERWRSWPEIFLNF